MPDDQGIPTEAEWLEGRYPGAQEEHEASDHGIVLPRPPGPTAIPNPPLSDKNFTSSLPQQGDRCLGCYQDPADGHMFDCPTRIHELEVEVERLLGIIDRYCKRPSDVVAENERLREALAAIARPSRIGEGCLDAETWAQLAMHSARHALEPGYAADGSWSWTADGPVRPGEPGTPLPGSMAAAVAKTWICRGWPESLDPPRPVKHQWMHGYHEVADGAACSICEATQDDPDRWDGISDPSSVGVTAETGGRA